MLQTRSPLMLFFFRFRLMDDQVGEAKACGNIGNVLKMQNLFTDAIVFTDRQLALAKQLEDKVSSILHFQVPYCWHY